MIPMYPYYGYENQCQLVPITFPPQHQDRQPGLEYIMNPIPISDNPNYKGSGKLMGKVAIITGGDSGIGRAVAIGFAKEGADVAIVYLNERRDAMDTKQMVEQHGRRCLLIEGDLRRPEFSAEAVSITLAYYGKINTLILNQAVNYTQMSLLNLSDQQLDEMFRTNVYPLFYLTRAALPYLRPGSTIINTTSVAAYLGIPFQVDYSSSKGAIVSFTRSLASQLVDQGIRVNAVAPGPVWTPLIAATFPPELIKSFGTNTAMKRAAQPFELAPTYIYLASDDSSYVTGQVLHVDGGITIKIG